MTLTQIITTDRENMKEMPPIVFSDKDRETEQRILNLFPEVQEQKLLGFGGSFTGSSARNYIEMNAEGRETLCRLLFDRDTGLGFRFCRLPIGSCDFSVKAYDYLSGADASPDSFDLGIDKDEMLPMVRDAIRMAKDEPIFLFASPWSPPAWMKDSGDRLRGGKLMHSAYDAYADYLCRYVLAMRKEGIRIGALTVQNEPHATQTWESCVYDAEDEARFTLESLIPALRSYGLSDVKVLIWDHNRERVYDRARDSFRVPGAREAIFGVGFHWYSGTHFGALDALHRAYPEKTLIETEFCDGLVRDVLGRSFVSGYDPLRLAYANDWIGNLNHGTSACVNWNMILDLEGGPYHDRDGGCQAPIHVDVRSGSIHVRKIYYEMAHFSRYILPGAVRIGGSVYDERLAMTAAKNPNGEIVCVVTNPDAADRTVNVRLDGGIAAVTLPAHSLNTLRILP